MPNHSASIQVCHGTRGSSPRPQGLCHWFRRCDKWHLPSLQLCVQKLRILIEDSDQNCELLPLQALQALRPRPPQVRARPRPRGEWAWHGWQIPPRVQPPRLHGGLLPAGISGCRSAVSTGKVFKLWALCPHPRGAGTRLQGGAGEAGGSTVETSRASSAPVGAGWAWRKVPAGMLQAPPAVNQMGWCVGLLTSEGELLYVLLVCQLVHFLQPTSAVEGSSQSHAPAARTTVESASEGLVMWAAQFLFFVFFVFFVCALWLLGS